MLLDVPAPVLVMLYILMTFTWFWITETRERALRFLGWLQRKVTGDVSAVEQSS